MSEKFDTARLTLKPFTKDALKQTYEWLHDPEIHELTLTPNFSEEEQLAWFQNLPLREDYITRIIYADDEMIGAWGLKKINLEEGHAEPFYYIGNKKYWGKGIGEWLMNKSIEKCEELGISKIIAIMLVKNFRIVNLHFKQGFKIRDYENGLYYMDKVIK